MRVNSKLRGETRKINAYIAIKWYKFLKDYCERNGLTMTTALHFALMELKSKDDEEFYTSKRDLTNAIEDIKDDFEDIKEILKECKSEK